MNNYLPWEVCTYTSSICCTNLAERIGWILTTLFNAFSSNFLSSGPLISNARTMLFILLLKPEGCIPDLQISCSCIVCVWIMVAGIQLIFVEAGGKLISSKKTKLPFCDSSWKLSPLGLMSSILLSVSVISYERK